MLPFDSTDRASRRGPARTRVLAAVLALGLLAGACSGGDDSAHSADPADNSASGGDTTTASAEAATDERIVVIGEEYLLADLLALGVTPVAATATVAEEGFHAVGDHDTSEIQALPATEPNLELLASLEPDHIIILEFFANQLGQDVLEGLGEVTVVPDGMDPAELVTMYGEMFGREERAAELVERYDAAQARAAEALAGQEVSVAAIYPGRSVAAFVDGPWAVPATLLEAGATLVPTPAEAAPDQNGRAYLSDEQLGLLSGSPMLLLQSPLVPGDEESVEEMEQNPLWESLPAVAAGEVIVLDRLGYPGIEGRIRLVDDLIEALG